MEIMNFDHPKWDEFISMLGDEILLNDCNSETDKPNTKKVLDVIGDIDIEKTFEFLEKNGGHCDCEIMLNVQIFPPCEGGCNPKGVIENKDSKDDSDKFYCHGCKNTFPTRPEK